MKWAFLTIAVCLATLMHAGAFSPPVPLSLAGGALIAVGILIAVHERYAGAIVFAAVCGLLHDCLSHNLLGSGMLVMTLAAAMIKVAVQMVRYDTALVIGLAFGALLFVSAFLNGIVTTPTSEVALRALTFALVWTLIDTLFLLTARAWSGSSEGLTDDDGRSSREWLVSKSL